LWQVALELVGVVAPVPEEILVAMFLALALWTASKLAEMALLT
jgi:hypothetical protein